ncbi:hypothetical protein LIER_35163 [Lithospermum erythrorhizon]|uniref:WAT1-related protein n=1 Tax=Lithospermum erythrorhizon TaxID=34254 RepID=A0AAV3NKS9_LITER
MVKVNMLTYIAVVIVQLVYTGQSLFSKASVNEGMKTSIFVVYQQAFATIALAPFAYFLERKMAPPITFRLFGKMLFIAVFGITLNLNFYYSAMKYASATFAIAMTNTIPPMVFIMAVLLRLERLEIRRIHGKAKVLGCVICVSGAMVFTFFKGPAMYSIGKGTNDAHSSSSHTHPQENWMKGLLLMLGATLTWSFWINMQAAIQKEYPAKLRFTTIQCCISSVVTAIAAAAMERKLSYWELGWNINLMSLLYCGILVGAVTFSLQIWVIGKKGPVFTAMFSPLSLVTTAILSALIFREILHWGSVLGGALLVAGLYCFLWGKNRETKAVEAIEIKNQIILSKENGVLECITTVCPPANDEPLKKKVVVL